MCGIAKTIYGYLKSGANKFPSRASDDSSLVEMPMLYFARNDVGFRVGLEDKE
jgi:hypothetical protein